MEMAAITDASWAAELAPDTVLFLDASNAVLKDQTLMLDAGDESLLPLRGPSFRIASGNMSQLGAPRLITWKDGVTVWEGKAPDAGSDAIDVAALDVPDGRYFLQQGERIQLDFFLTRRVRLPCVLNLQVSDFADAAPVDLKICFQARALHWRYLFRTSSDLDLSGATLRSSVKGVKFEQPVPETQTPRFQWSAISTAPVPLSLQTAPDVELVFSDGDQRHRRPVRLPSPTAGSIRIVTLDDIRTEVAESMVNLA